MCMHVSGCRWWGVCEESYKVHKIATAHNIHGSDMNTKVCCLLAVILLSTSAPIQISLASINDTIGLAFLAITVKLFSENKRYDQEILDFLETENDTSYKHLQYSNAFIQSINAYLVLTLYNFCLFLFVSQQIV